MRETHSGSYLCGAVRIGVAGSLGKVVYCHCTQCRKQTGHFYAGINVADGDLTIAGEGEVAWFQSSTEARRGFCRVCGSTLFWKAAAMPYTSILAGCIDGETQTEGARHDFAGSKGDYYRIDDSLPQNDRFP